MDYHDVIDPNRHITQQLYDDFGRMRKVYEFSGDCYNNWIAAYTCAGQYTTPWATYSTTSYNYNGLNQLTQVIDNVGNTTTLNYDSFGRKTSMVDPDMGSWSYGYDASSNLISQTDAKVPAQTLTFQYDELNRLKLKTYPNNSTAQFFYDEATSTNGKGRQTSMSNANATTRWQYDDRGRITTASYSNISGLTGTRSFSWSYDSADRVTSATYPNSEVLTYAYDAAWRATSMCTSLGGCYITQTQYTVTNQRLSQTQMTLGNGVKQTTNFGGLLQQLQQIQLGTAATPGSLFDRSYSYDLGGNVKTITNNVSGQAQTQNYTYDHRDRLTRAWTTGGSNGYDETYAYDTIGNITSKGPTSGGATSYTYPAAGQARPHAPTSVGGQSYSYDNNGNLLSGSNRSYNWNVDNQPTSVTGPDGVPETYTYDAMGARLSRTRQGTTTYYFGLWEEESTGKTRAHYKFGGEVIAQRERVSGVDTVIYLSSDHLGSASLATSSSGTLVSQQEFDSWGKVRSGGVSQTTINYTGQKLDGTGLLYYHARMYDPGLAKFVSADSIVPGAGDPQSFNRYSYVRNNPLGYTDPTGHCKKDRDGEKDRTNDATCWGKYDAVVATFGYEPEGLDDDEWDTDRLQSLLDWMDAGVKFTDKPDKNGNRKYKWDAQTIGQVLEALDDVKKAFGFDKAKEILGLTKSPLTFSLADLQSGPMGGGEVLPDDPRTVYLNGGLYQKGTQAGFRKEKVYRIIHELGHIADWVAGGGISPWSNSFIWEAAHIGGTPASGYAVANSPTELGEDFAETFMWLVVNKATGQTTFTTYDGKTVEPDSFRLNAVQCSALKITTC